MSLNVSHAINCRSFILKPASSPKKLELASINEIKWCDFLTPLTYCTWTDNNQTTQNDPMTQRSQTYSIQEPLCKCAVWIVVIRLIRYVGGSLSVSWYVTLYYGTYIRDIKRCFCSPVILRAARIDHSWLTTCHWSGRNSSIPLSQRRTVPPTYPNVLGRLLQQTYIHCSLWTRVPTGFLKC